MLYNPGMMRVGSSRGFTMVETVIFLAVSSALFVSAMLLMSGQQAKTEFRQAIGEVQSQVDDVANDVSTGYYATNGNVTCTADAAGVTIGTGTVNNGQCIFLGRVVQFDVNAAGNTMINTYNVLGRRLDSSNKPVSTLADASATLMESQYNTFVVPSGLTVYKTFYKSNPTDAVGQEIKGFALVSSLASYNASDGGLLSGSSTVDVMPILDAGGSFADMTNSALRNVHPIKNPGGGVYVCLDSGGTNQHVILRIGVGGDLASTLTIKNGKSINDTENCT